MNIQKSYILEGIESKGTAVVTGKLFSNWSAKQ